MRLALAEAELAPSTGDVPIGAVVVDAGGAVLGRGRNRREADADPTAHAEVLALRAAAAAAGTWRLEGCTLVVTMEPCSMCAGALVLARVDRLVYGAPDPRRAPSARSGTSSVTAGSTTAPRCWPASSPTSAARWSARSSPPSAPDIHRCLIHG